MRKIFLSLLVVPLLSGCGTTSRLLLDGGAAAGGAAIANALSDSNPYAIAGGAAAGAILSEGGQAIVRNNQKKSFDEGYVKGRSDGVKTLYWNLQDQQRTNRNRRLPAN